MDVYAIKYLQWFEVSEFIFVARTVFGDYRINCNTHTWEFMSAYPTLIRSVKYDVELIDQGKEEAGWHWENFLGQFLNLAVPKKKK